MMQSSYEQPLNLVKKKISPTKITRMLSTGGGTLNTATDLVICKLCNSYVVAAKIDTHNRLVNYYFISLLLLYNH